MPMLEIRQIGFLNPVRKLAPYLAELEQAWVNGRDSDAIAHEFDDDWQLIRDLQSRASEQAQFVEEASHLCAELLLAAPTLLQMRLTRQELIEWIDLGLPSAETRGEIREVAMLLTLRGMAQRELQSLTAAAESFQRAVNCYLESGDELEAARAQANLSITVAFQGQPLAALHHLQDARNFFESVGDDTGLMKCVGCISVVEQRLRNYRSAKESADRYLELAQEFGSRQDEILALGQLGTCYRRLASEADDSERLETAEEQLELSIGYYQRQKELAQTAGDLPAQQRAIGNIGIVYSEMNRIDAAIPCYCESMHLAKLCGNYRACAADQTNLGLALLGLGNDVEAEELFQQALAYYRASDEAAYEAIVLWNLSMVAEARGEAAHAIELLQQCLTIRQRIDDPRVAETKNAIEDLLPKERPPMNQRELSWENVRLVVLMVLGRKRVARIFDRGGDEWWLSPNQTPRFVGRNEPPDDGNRLECSGADARTAVEQFLAGE